MIILLIIGGVFAVILAAVLFSLFYKAPSCVDGIQNQGEQGIDCGGPCANLCTAGQDAPTVLFTKAIPNGVGRTDVLAYVENKNAAAAAKAVPYTITLYGADQSLIQQIGGTVDVPPASTVPVFVPGVASGKQIVTAAFLTIDSSTITWYSYKESRAFPLYDNDATLSNATTAPRIDATISNSSAMPVQNVRVVAAVRDAAGSIIAASATIIPAIGGQSRAQATFTWNQPFSGTAASIEIIPLVQLP